MRRWSAAAVLLALGLTGCGLLDRVRAARIPPPQPPTYSQYHLNGWSWDGVARVLVLPVRNESGYTRAGDEVHTALAAELQRVGRFEVVAAPQDDRATLAERIHHNGRFDEGLVLDLARKARADVVLFGTVTEYSPYPRPRLGLVLQAVGPPEAKVVASADGLWDSTDGVIAERARAYYRQRPRPKPPWVRNHVIAEDDGFAGDLALDSPALFQRFVCFEAVLALLGQPIPGVVVNGTAGCPPGSR